MNIFWDYFWPLLAAGLVIGAIAGAIGFRLPKSLEKDNSEMRRKRMIALSAGTAAIIAATALWSGPLGGANRLTQRIEHDARLTLDNYEMTQLSAHLHRGPLSRTLVLSGPADDFQRSELLRIMNLLAGVRDVSWSNRGGVPLFAESALAALLGFLFGLLLAYLIELRRRHNAQWNW
jgi:hypothetical protein